MKSELQRLKDKRRDLHLKLIDVGARIDSLNDIPPLERLGFAGDPESRLRQSHDCEAERTGIQGQIAYLDKEVDELEQQKRVAKAITKQVPKKQMVYERIQELQKQEPGKKKVELFSQVADEQNGSDTAVKKAYYDYEKDIRVEQSRKAKERRGEETGHAAQGGPEKKSLK